MKEEKSFKNFIQQLNQLCENKQITEVDYKQLEKILKTHRKLPH